jgi:dipeptidyl aminopeptidase/acylaminoacyl peptidase
MRHARLRPPTRSRACSSRSAVRLLIVHSGGDEVCPVEESERMRSAAKGHATLVVFPDGNHVCDNIPYKVRPLMADWVARQLGPA